MMHHIWTTNNTKKHLLVASRRRTNRLLIQNKQKDNMKSGMLDFFLRICPWHEVRLTWGTALLHGSLRNPCNYTHPLTPFDILRLSVDKQHTWFEVPGTHLHTLVPRVYSVSIHSLSLLQQRKVSVQSRAHQNSLASLNSWSQNSWLRLHIVTTLFHAFSISSSAPVQPCPAHKTKAKACSHNQDCQNTTVSR